jgi:hypothetical protein
MALELLYGPTPITFGAVPVAAVGNPLTWMQGVGLLMPVQPAGGSYGLYATQMDGNTLGPRSTFSGSYTAVLDLRSARGLAMLGSGALYGFNYLAGQPNPAPLLASASLNIRVITADGRYLSFNGSGVSSSTDGVTFTSEYAWAAPDASSFQCVSRGSSSTEICVLLTNNQLRFYDTVGKTQNGPSLFVGESASGVWYVPKYNVFVELLGPQIKILANMVAPATLSNPVASPAVVAGDVSKLTVQLLGAQSEPCVGELIDWSVASGSGSLILPQSVTDANGNATNSLVVPVGSTGSVVVDASLSY